MGQAGHNSSSHQIVVAGGDYERDLRGCLSSSIEHGAARWDHDDVDVQSHEFTCKLRQTLGLFARPAVFDDEVLPLNPAELPKCIVQGLGDGRPGDSGSSNARR